MAIKSRWADGRLERLPKLAAELVSLHVTAIVGSFDAALAAKTATTSIPIVFVTGADPVAAGLVSSISRPGGNITGVSFSDVPVTGKRLALLRELVPNAEIIAVLQDANFSQFQAETREIESAARAIGQKIVTLKAIRPRKLMQPFRRWCSPVPEQYWWAQVASLAVGGQVVGLAAPHAIPASYPVRGSVDAGGGQLWSQSDRCLSPCWRLCRPHSQG